VSNEIAISDEQNVFSHTAPSAPTGPGYSYPTSTQSPAFVTPSTTPSSYVPTTPSPYPPSAFSGVTPEYYPSTPRPFSRPIQEPIQVSTPGTIGGIDRYNNYVTSSVPSYPSGGPSPLLPSASSSEEHHDLIYGLLPPKEEPYYTKAYIPPTPTIPQEIHITPAAHTYIPTHPPPPQPPTLSVPPSIVYQTPLYHPSQPSPSQYPYLPTNPSPSQYPYLPTLPTIAANYHTIPPQSAVGDAPVRNNAGWFYGIAPGAGKRAHIQNIDLVPINERALSPSEALRRDEEREAYHRQSHQQQHPLL
jgi:hypothetical protein